MRLARTPLKADHCASTYLLEFSYFDEVVLKQAVSAIIEKLISENAIDSHNLRVSACSATADESPRNQWHRRQRSQPSSEMFVSNTSCSQAGIPPERTRG